MVSSRCSSSTAIEMAPGPGGPLTNSIGWKRTRESRSGGGRLLRREAPGAACRTRADDLARLLPERLAVEAQPAVVEGAPAALEGDAHVEAQRVVLRGLCQDVIQLAGQELTLSLDELSVAPALDGQQELARDARERGGEPLDGQDARDLASDQVEEHVPGARRRGRGLRGGGHVHESSGRGPRPPGWRGAGPRARRPGARPAGSRRPRETSPGGWPPG